jgi:hypothetical protein
MDGMRWAWAGSIAAALIGLASEASAQPAIDAPYRPALKVETSLAATVGSPTQMCWGPLGRLYVMSHDAGIVSYRYNWLTGKLTSPIRAVPSARGIGLGFHGAVLYYSTLTGGLVKATDDDGDGVYGEVDQGELGLEIVRGIPTGDHTVDQIQIVGDTLYVGIGRRTINGRTGDLSGGTIDDFGGRGFFYGGRGVTWGDSAYNGTIAWIRDLTQVVDAVDSANAFNNPASPPTQGLIREDFGPYSASPGKLTVHSAGTRNPFGLCLDAEGRLFFTNNYNRATTGGDGTNVVDHPRDGVGSDLRLSVHDQLFAAAEGADYGYADDVWRGRTPMLPVGAMSPNRVASITPDNLANPGPYSLHDPARPVGLGPSSSANGCGFFYSAALPPALAGNLFIARYNPSVADSSGRTIRYADVVAVDVSTGDVKRVATGFQNPIAVLWDGANRLLVADFTTGTGKPGAIYSLAVGR